MYSSLSVSESLEKLSSSLQGLKQDQVESLREEYGNNELPKKTRSKILLFFRQFHDVLIYILIGALALSIATPFLEGHQVELRSFADAFVILGILVLNAVLGFVQEFKAEQAIALLEKLSSPHARVRREGTEMIIESREIVPGDILIIEEGDRIAADGRIVLCSHLRTNESSLTGETAAVNKQLEKLASDSEAIADQKNMVFSGTIVTRGSAEVVVTATALQTQIGKIAKLVSETKLPETPLEQRMKGLGKMLGLLVIALCVLIVGVGYLQGLSLIAILLIGVSLAVSAVPEGLPAVITVSLALGVRRMVEENTLVRRLDALETLGSVTVICSDKTGTITENKMKVVEVWRGQKGQKSEKRQKGGVDHSLLQAVASCNRAQLPNIGDPTEIGLLEYGLEQGIERLVIDEIEVPFSSSYKYMQTRHGDVSYIKGAPEVVLEMCSDCDPEEILQKNEELAAKGLRVLAAAVKRGEELTFLGLVAMEDPPREGVDRAITLAKNAGVRTMMITGDNIITAKAIAEKVGIEGGALQGVDLDALSDEELGARLKTVSVFARVSPEHKLRLLQILQDAGEIVAMSGDGVNDAPALKGAHVGVAMGMIGTDVARDAASVVLTDDNYSTIVHAIREGRRIYDNIKKFVLLLLRSNFDELLLITVVILIGLPLPYLPIHILWINLMTDSLPALALGMEKAEPDIMDRPPRDPDEHLLHGEGRRLVFAALLGFTVSFVYYLWLLRSGSTVEHARTAMLTLAIISELFMAFTVRSTRPLWEIGIFSNKWLLGAISIPFIAHLLLLFTPLGVLFHLTSLTGQNWIEVLVLSLIGFAVFEVMKILKAES